MSPTGPTRLQFLTLGLPRGTGFGRHRHDDHQLVVVDRGVVGLATPGAVWAVPAGCGVWLPARAEHEVVGIGDASATFAYLAGAAVALPLVPGAVSVTPLVRELIATLSSSGARRGDRRTRLERHYSTNSPSSVRFGSSFHYPRTQPPARSPQRSSRLRRIAAPSTSSAPKSGRVDERCSGASPPETGLGFRAWRRMARLQGAMVALQAGASVTATAYACGWSSVSAFVIAFRTEIGATPAEWARGSTPH